MRPRIGAYTDLLTLVGAKFEKARFVQDGKVMTGGGVTAGIDFAFHVAAQIAGADAAKAIQLSLEYDPAPPFASGHPDRVTSETERLARERYAKSRSLSISTERLGCVIGRRARPLERLLARGCGYGDRRPRLLRLAEGERICARERKTAQVRCGLGLRDDA